MHIATCLIDDRVDPGPRDLRRYDPIGRPPSRHVTCKNKIVWEHSPTRIKWRERTRLNRGVTSPINYLHVSSMSITHGALHGRPRGLLATWRAPCASCVGHTCPTTWPQRHVVTARWTCAPRGSARHVSPAWARSPRQLRGKPTPFFRFFNRKIQFKNQIKFGKEA